VSLALLLVAVLAGPPPTGGGAWNDDQLVVIIGDGGASGSTGSGAAGDQAPYRYVWRAADSSGSSSIGLEHLCPSGDPANPFGWVYQLTVLDLAGAVVGQETRCVPLDPDGGQPAAPPVPPVPSVGDIWRAALARIPAPALGINPEPVGLTGLETWFWADGPAEIAIAVSIGEWTVTGTAHLADLTFDTGDGATATSAGSGSQAEPATRHVYETKGTYDITVNARWIAEVVMSGAGLAARPTPIGSAALQSTTSYPVQEVRAILVP
jgi:hypothetical protein